MRSLVLVAAAMSLIACASIKPVAYTAQPERIADPAAEAKALVLANTVQGCVTEPDFVGTMLVVKFVCSNGVGNATAKLDRVKSIELQQYGEWYRVLLKHSDSSDDFDWTSKSLEDMQRLADALTALSKAATKQNTPPANTTVL